MVPLIEDKQNQSDSGSQERNLKRKEPVNNPEEIITVRYPLTKSKPSKKS